MRLATRYGWRWALWHALMQIVSLALTCASCIALVVATRLGTWLLAGLSLAGIAGHPLPQPVPLRLAIACALFAVVAFALLMQMVEATVRDVREARARYRALRGDAAAMPLARMAPFPEEAPNVTYLPLEGLVSPIATSHKVSADDRGMHVRPPSGRERTVRWEDARLLEVISDPSTKYLTYALRGRGGSVTWGDRRSAGTADARLAYANLHRQLLALIYARTGLVPRTNSSNLHAPDANPQGQEFGVAVDGERPRPLRVRDILYYGVWLVVIGLLAAGAVACLALPLTGVLVANIYAAASVGLLALVLLGAILWGIASRAGLHAFRHLANPSLPTLPAPPVLGRYTLAWRHSVGNQLSALAVGVALLADIVPFVLSFATSRMPSLVLFLADMPLVLLLSVGLFVLFSDGVPHRFAVVVEEAGLAQGTVAIPWEEAGAFEWRGKPGKGTFSVTSMTNGTLVIDWPERPSRVLPARDAQPITPTELAALVVARSGKTLQTTGE